MEGRPRIGRVDLEAGRERPVRGTVTFVAFAFILLLPSANSIGAEGEWQFVLPKPDDPFEYPPLRALAVSRTKPEDVREMVHYRGARQRYAQIRYGSPGSIRITVVLDEVSASDVDLYVDSDRNRRIEAKDRVSGKGRTWKLPMAVAVVEGETTKLTPRAAIFRLGATGVTFSFAAAGYLEGTVRTGWPAPRCASDRRRRQRLSHRRPGSAVDRSERRRASGTPPTSSSCIRRSFRSAEAGTLLGRTS